MAKRVSQKQIADDLGLSRQVVSAILSDSAADNTARFSDDTFRRVIAYAEEIGYRTPQRRVVSAQRTHRIGLLIYQSVYVIPTPLLDFLTQVAHARSINLMAGGQKRPPKNTYNVR